MSELSLFGVEPERLTAPISDIAPAGEPQQYEAIYDQIKEARREEDASLPQGVWQRELKVADWALVKQLCVDTLVHKSKDLQLVAWLAEAMLVLDGLPGGAAALGLMADLSERYWDGMYPTLEEGDMDVRLAPIVWLDRVLAERLGDTPLCDTGPRSNLGYRLRDWEDALQRDVLLKAGKIKEQDLEGKVTKEQVTATWAMTRAAFFDDLLGRLERVLGAKARLERVLRDKVGKEAPILRKLGDRGSKLEQTLRRARTAAIPPEADLQLPTEPAEEEDFGEMAAQLPAEGARLTGVGGAVGRGPIRSRAEAYRRLAEVAEYLIRTEPHSPAGYLVNRAVAWGDMRLRDVLQEIVGNPSDLQNICSLLGISARDEEASE